MDQPAYSIVSVVAAEDRGPAIAVLVESQNMRAISKTAFAEWVGERNSRDKIHPAVNLLPEMC